ncbi:MAG: ribonuclease Z [Actinobacteria bacterium]|nr:MAG: ribonuclease Z [Actinomycetota bacterium]
MTSLTFLGTGNFLAPGRYWNSFVVDTNILVEPAPTVLPHLRRCGLAAKDLEVVVISHFHADHTFGWPFLLLELLKSGRDRPLSIVGPPDVDAFLSDMMSLGAVRNVHDAAHAELDLRYVEVDGSWQAAGPLRFRAIEVDHVPHLRCFGYLLERGHRTIAYSGDTQPCAGLDELVGASDTAVLECNGRHPEPTHMDLDAIRALRARFPAVPFVLTHVGPDVDASGIGDAVLPDDFETLNL